MSKIAKQKWEPLSTIMDRISGQLPPNTFTNADGTPYTASGDSGLTDVIRKVVREELAAMKAGLIKEAVEAVKQSLAQDFRNSGHRIGF